MIEEIRIYYESIEQGANYIFPIIQKILKKLNKKIEFNLVKLKGSYSYYSKRVAPIIYWKDPDILITAIIKNEEYPLVLIEFSNAVFTEDHELQRFDGLVAAAENNCVYVKISPISKISVSEHGGKTDFDYIGPYSLILKKYNQTFYHFDWEVDSKGVVKVNPDYVACPNEIKEFNFLLDNILNLIVDNLNEKWINQLNKKLIADKYFKKWSKTLANFKFLDIKNLNTDRTKWIEEDSIFELKLNRFGHAMDPERGMLAYYGVLHDKIVSKMLFDSENDAWYKDIPKENEIQEYINKKGLRSGYDFLYCFMLGSGMYNSDDFKKLVEKFESDNSEKIELNLTDFLKNNFPKLNKALRTIFKCSIKFYIEDSGGNKRVVFKWNKIDHIKSKNRLPKVTNIIPRTSLDEDDVTYITIHNILKPNGFKIIAVSYPGAQADRVILVEPGKGRKQKRKYIDIISFLPQKATNLQENKGIFSPSQLQEDINEISKYKTETSYKDGLKDFLKRFSPEALKYIIKIGVGFWSNKNFKISKIKDLDLKELDYFVYITNDMKKWNIWSTGSNNIFSIKKGDVVIPTVFEVVVSKNNAKLSCFL